MKKIVLKKILTNLHLLPLVEQVKFYSEKWRNRKDNAQFIKNNPNVKLPPDFYLYETFNLNYSKFYSTGKPTAEWLINHISEFKDFNNVTVLDWGCGTGRILRHLPEVAGKNNSYFGCDYNEKYIKWCAKNLDGIQFKINNLKPPTGYNESKFDIIYGISIFTHLSEELHYSWMKELTKILKKDGIIFLTTHGDAHKFKLLPKEQELYNNGNLVAHQYNKEGNRLFASYQSPKFFRKLCKNNNLEILKHIPGEIKNNKVQQDIWLLTPKN